MKQITLFVIGFAAAVSLHAQQFISKGNVEFEVKTNMKKVWGGDNPWSEMLQDQLPPFKTAYYHFTFAAGKSLYKFHHFDDASLKIPEFMRKDDEEGSWFTDQQKGEMTIVKNIFGSVFSIKDSLKAVEWRFSNESRVIAGFNCRKAIGKIYDSVYVFAFYTDEITISGGPCSITGLPGMILGMTIPRLYTSWIATKLNIEGIDEAKIISPAVKKPYTIKEYRKTLIDKSKDWGGDGDESSKKWIEQFLWSAML